MKPRVIGSYDQLLALVDSERIDKIVISMADRRGKMPFEALVTCKMKGVEIQEGATFYEQISGKIMLENLRPSWVIFSSGFRVSALLRGCKRLADMVGALIGLLLTAPLMAVIALLIKVDSRGPALFSQERVGEGGKNFILFKFRSMYDDAEAATGPVFADRDDIRITRIGRFLRTVRFDELPQLFNVLKGDMSFVGPRPERPFFVEQFSKEIPYYAQRLSVKPGLTGWAQVNYPYGATLQDAVEKLQLDLFYIKNMSLWLDMFIILKTLKIALIGEGAR